MLPSLGYLFLLYLSDKATMRIVMKVQNDNAMALIFMTKMFHRQIYMG